MRKSLIQWIVLVLLTVPSAWAADPPAGEGSQAQADDEQIIAVLELLEMMDLVQEMDLLRDMHYLIEGDPNEDDE
jgi:hypothetical protein